MMRLLTPLLLTWAIFGCTRGNPAFGAGDTDGSDTGRESGDPSGDPSAGTSSDSMSSTGNVESGTSGVTTSASTSNSSGESQSGADTLEPARDCCQKHEAPGCDAPDVEMCVCEAIDACCTEGWSSDCVEKASHCNAGCAMSSTTQLTDSGSDSLSTTSDGGTSTTDGGTTTDGGGSTTIGSSPCCDPSAIGGCNADAEIEACVCELDNGCCNEAWAQNCIDLATENCSLVCG
jgi:hypothetical protein